jgi:hypothetical protein
MIGDIKAWREESKNSTKKQSKRDAQDADLQGRMKRVQDGVVGGGAASGSPKQPRRSSMGAMTAAFEDEAAAQLLEAQSLPSRQHVEDMESRKMAIAELEAKTAAGTATANAEMMKTMAKTAAETSASNTQMMQIMAKFAERI